MAWLTAHTLRAYHGGETQMATGVVCQGEPKRSAIQRKQHEPVMGEL